MPRSAKFSHASSADTRRVTQPLARCDTPQLTVLAAWLGAQRSSTDAGPSCNVLLLHSTIFAFVVQRPSHSAAAQCWLLRSLVCASCGAYSMAHWGTHLQNVSMPCQTCVQVRGSTASEQAPARGARGSLGWARLPTCAAGHDHNLPRSRLPRDLGPRYPASGKRCGADGQAAGTRSAARTHFDR